MRLSHRSTLVIPFLLSLLALLAGCGKSGNAVSPSGSAVSDTDQAQVSQEIARHPELVEDGVSESSDPTTVSSAAPAGSSGIRNEIHPVTFWRTIRSVERRFEFAFSDTDSTGQATTAVVIIHKHFLGSFNILVRDQTAEGAPPEGHVVHKPLDDHWVRRILLKRVRVSEADRAVWKIVATSGVKITSRNAETRLVSLRVQSASLDTTITEPLAFLRLRRILKLGAGDEVTITATTLRNDDVVLLYARAARMRFHNNGDNTYSATWKAPEEGRLHHFGVNALSRGTLFDDAAPYDSQSWILPYVVPPGELADFAE